MSFINYRGKSGFTLIETLVATLLLSISVVIIIQLFSSGLRAGSLSTDYVRAVYYAREKMEELLLLPSQIEGSKSGIFDEKYKWISEIEKIEEDDDERKEDNLPIALYHIHIDVSWREGIREKHFDIGTLTISENIGE